MPKRKRKHAVPQNSSKPTTREPILFVYVNEDGLDLDQDYFKNQCRELGHQFVLYAPGFDIPIDGDTVIVGGRKAAHMGYDDMTVVYLADPEMQPIPRTCGMCCLTYSKNIPEDLARMNGIFILQPGEELSKKIWDAALSRAHYSLCSYADGD